MMSLQINHDDVSTASRLLGELNQVASQACGNIRSLRERVESGEVNTTKGVSFLEVKNQLMLGYLTNLTHVMTHKVKGKSLQESADVHRLVEIRTVLEKMRPIDQKLRYQVDKLLKSAATGVSENDPLRLKPNAANMVSKLGDEGEESGSDGESGDEEDKPEKAAVYRPPKLAAMHYEGDETELERKQKVEDRQKKQRLSSTIMKELRAEYTDAPEEIREGADQHRHRDDKASKERAEYEENYFMRKQLSKKEKASTRQLATMSGLHGITSFGSSFGGESSDGPPSKKRKTAKSKNKGKKKAGGKRIKFH